MKAVIDGVTYEGTPDEIAEIVKKVKPRAQFDWFVPACPCRPSPFPNWPVTMSDEPDELGITTTCRSTNEHPGYITMPRPRKEPLQCSSAK